MASKNLYDDVIVWDQDGAGRLEADGHVRPVELTSLRGRRVVMVLARRLTQVRSTALPPASPEDLRRLVAMRLSDLFPAATDMAFSVAPRSGEGTGVPGPVAVFAARNADLAAIGTAAKANGFRVIATLPASAGSVELAEELGLPDALVLERDGDGVGLDVISGLELVLSRRTPAESSLEGEVRRTFIAAKTGAIPIVATNGFIADFADRHSPKTATATLLEHQERWPQLDLIPEAVRAARFAQIRYHQVRRGALILISALLLNGYVAKVRLDAAADVDAKTKKANAQVRRFETTLNLYAAQNQKLAPQGAVLARAFQPAQRVSDVTVLVSSVVPPGIWLTNFSVDRGKPLQIRGTATNSAAASAYLRNLAGQNRFRDVRLLFANTAEVENKPVINFSITAFPIGNVPLEEAKRKR